MTKVIKGGTVVTADRQFKADVLIEGEVIAAIGENLKGDEVIDASEAYSCAASGRSRGLSRAENALVRHIPL